MPIQFNQVSYTYSPKTPFEYTALKDVSLTIQSQKMTAIIGATGSGKSTLIQQLNALIVPTQGEIIVEDKHIVANEKNKGLKALRQKVGLVFQFPEAQLFEETILKDVMFGPLNFGKTQEEAKQAALDALNLVNLPSELYQQSPLDLSGGQKRRVAIAGILALKPDILVCDEPTAGLDPQGAKQMMTLFKQYQTKLNKTVLLVTHDLQHVLEYCDDVVLLDQGQVLFHGSTQEFFRNQELLSHLSLVLPKVIQIRNELNQKGYYLPDTITNVQELALAIKKELNHE